MESFMIVMAIIFFQIILSIVVWKITKKINIKQEMKEKEQDSMSISELYFDTLFPKYVDFQGRATRKEYFTFFIINAIITIVLIFTIPQVATFFNFAVLIPGTAVAARRIRDTGLSGLWGWLFIPLALPMIVVAFTPSNGFKQLGTTLVDTKEDIFSRTKKPNNYNDIADALLKYQRLLDTGAISQKDFDDIKKDLLSKR